MGAGLQAWGEGKRKRGSGACQRKGEEMCRRGSEQVLRLGTLPLQGDFRAVSGAGMQPPSLSLAQPVGTLPAFWCFFPLVISPPCKASKQGTLRVLPKTTPWPSLEKQLPSHLALGT